MQALVTGGAGFIGSHVVEALVERGAQVSVIDNFATGLMENLAKVTDRITLERADLAVDDVTPLIGDGRFDLIVHAAGNASIPASIADPRRDLEANVVATLNLLRAVRNASPDSAVVNLSSSTVYAEGSGDPMSEAHPLGPISPYGISKLASESYVRLHSHLHGRRSCNVRIFSVFGPRLRKQVVWDFLSRLAADPAELVLRGDGSEKRNPTHVKNIAEAIILVAEKSGMNGDVYNIGSAETVSIAELARDVAVAMGLRPVIRHSESSNAGHARSWAADITKLESLGYRQRVTYSDGLADTVSWFRSSNPTPL